MSYNACRFRRTSLAKTAGISTFSKVGTTSEAVNRIREASGAGPDTAATPDQNWTSGQERDLFCCPHLER